MKKGILALLALLNGTLLMAQAEFDALRFIQPDINGTARYMSMAGTFGALGGDVSGIKDNPAGLGIFQNSQVVATGNFFLQNTNADWYTVKATNNLTKIGYNNFSGVYFLRLKKGEDEKGLLNCNFSFSYNRLKNFNRTMKIKGKSNNSSLADYIESSLKNTQIMDSDLTYSNNRPWISVLSYNGGLIRQNGFWQSTLTDQTVTPTYNLTEKGYIDEYALSWAGNYSNFIYFGATANIQAINYTAISDYNELYSDGLTMKLMDTIYTKGKGISFNIGAIVCPLKFLRVGLSVHTPTLYALTNKNHATLNNDTIVATTPEGSYQYKLKNPLQLSASVAYLLGDKANVSVEYDLSNSTGTELLDVNGVATDSGTVNTRMKQKYNAVHTFKFGAEYNITNEISVRAGYAFSNNAIKADSVNTEPTRLLRSNYRTDTEYFFINNTSYITFGCGFHKAKWSVDLAYMNKAFNELFYPYDSSAMSRKTESATIKTTNNNLVLTFAYKF